MSDIGDRVQDSVLHFCFHTVNATGAPTTLSGTPALSCYKAADTTQSTAGITLTVDFDGVTGLNNVEIDLSADGFYASENDFSVVITTGTVDGTIVVGYVVATFSIENRSERARVVSWAGTVVTVSATSALPEVDAKSISDSAAAANSVESNIGNLDAAVASRATNAAAADAVWDEARAGHVAAGSFGEGVASVQGNVTGSVGSLASGAIAAASIAAAAANKIADHVLRRTFANARASSDGDTTGFRSLLGAVGKLVNRVAISLGTLTVYREDDSTAFGTQAVSTDANAEPVTGLNTT